MVVGCKKKRFALPSLATKVPFPVVKPHPSFRGVFKAADCSRRSDQYKIRYISNYISYMWEKN